MRVTCLGKGFVSGREPALSMTGCPGRGFVSDKRTCFRYDSNLSRQGVC